MGINIKKNRYNRHCDHIAKNRPVINADQILLEAGRKNAKASNDTQNRKYVVDTIKKYVKSGKNINEALDLIMEDNIIKEFEYLKKNGLNIREIFYNWVKNYLSNEEKEGFDRDE